MFTERQRKNAKLAKEAQMRMGYPSIRDIDGIINYLLPNQTWITLQKFGNVTWDLLLEKQKRKNSRHSGHRTIGTYNEQKYYTMHRFVLYWRTHLLSKRL